MEEKEEEEKERVVDPDPDLDLVPVPVEVVVAEKEEEEKVEEEKEEKEEENDKTTKIIRHLKSQESSKKDEIETEAKLFLAMKRRQDEDDDEEEERLSHDENVSVEQLKSIRAWRAPLNQSFLHDQILKITELSLILQFFLELIKQSNDSLNWKIISISSLVSFITIIDLQPLLVGTSYSSFHVGFGWTKNLSLSALSITTTLIASWIKSKRFLTRINQIIKRISRLEKLKSDLEYELRIPLSAKTNFFSFLRAKKEDLADVLSISGIISPRELVHTLYTLTTQYETIVVGSPPFYKRCKKSGRMKLNVGYVKLVIASYQEEHESSNKGKCCCRSDPRTTQLLSGFDV